MTTPSAQDTPSALPPLPQTIISLIGEYGFANRNSRSEAEITYRWSMLVDGIKAYGVARGKLDTALALAKSEQAAPPAAMALPDWIPFMERLPGPGERVEVMSESWQRPKWLTFDLAHKMLRDPSTSMHFWYPERMKWRPLDAAPPVAAEPLPYDDRTKDGSPYWAAEPDRSDAWEDWSRKAKIKAEPARKPLTEEQISTLYREHYPDSWMADGSLLRFARAIEAAHGIKEAS